MPERWIDISVPLFTGMVVWPDDPPVSIEQVQSQAKGDLTNTSLLAMSAHTGTHVDAPYHYVASGARIDAMPPDATIGPARVIEMTHERFITAGDLEDKDLQRGERILFKTRNSARAWQRPTVFDDQYVYISVEAARVLVQADVRTVGVDYLSVGGLSEDGVETHKALLKAGIWIIEGLHLAAVAPGRFELVCLPLLIRGGDGAPARAMLRPLAE